MLAIGLAKQKGAEATHFLRYENMAENIIAVASVALEQRNVICGVSTIENGYGRLAKIHVSRKEEIMADEPDYLQDAWNKMARLALNEIDVLIVGEIGKEISGTGMDTNIVGRFHTCLLYTSGFRSYFTSRNIDKNKPFLSLAQDLFGKVVFIIEDTVWNTGKIHCIYDNVTVLNRFLL